MSLPPNSPNPEPLNLETITGDLGTIGVFIEGLEHFICELRALVPEQDNREKFYRQITSIDTMAFEIKQRVAEMRTNLDEFIDAAPAAHLWAERKSV